MQQRKNIRLLIILLTLIVISVALSFKDKTTSSRLIATQDLFQTQAPENIDRILLKGYDFENDIARIGESWTINSQI